MAQKLTFPRPQTLFDAIIVYLSQETFGKAIRDNVRALYFAQISDFQFQDQMIQLFERHFEDAWSQGAAQCGIQPGERTAEEADRLNSFIFQQANYLPTYAQAILRTREQAIEAGELDPENPNTRKYKQLRPLMNRAKMWENRWNEVKALGQQMACADQKSQWKINPAKESCRDCLRAKDRVYRNSVWAAYGWRPQSPELACGGHHCGCRLEPTDKPVTPGRPPALAGG